MKADHVIANSDTQSFHCLHCGDVQKIPLPMRVSVFVAFGKAFSTAHRYCKKPETLKCSQKLS